MMSHYEQPSRLGHLLQRIVRSKGLAEQSSGQELNKIWKASAGERVAARSHVRRLRGGILEIGVSNGTILEELRSYLQHELLTTMQQRHPEPPIKSLKFIKTR
ncbi:MAG TPA: DUF721 domain-containing protein [Planctomycetes bacterium]|nr:DUF721 domain-containing protein [Fuerstiella sp.]HIK90387.1 DUF721 domain-containing protein [Planctomycetota bacterium]